MTAVAHGDGLAGCQHLCLPVAHATMALLDPILVVIQHLWSMLCKNVWSVLQEMHSTQVGRHSRHSVTLDGQWDGLNKLMWRQFTLANTTSSLSSLLQDCEYLQASCRRAKHDVNPPLWAARESHHRQANSEAHSHCNRLAFDEHCGIKPSPASPWLTSQHTYDEYAPWSLL